MMDETRVGDPPVLALLQQHENLVLEFQRLAAELKCAFRLSGAAAQQRDSAYAQLRETDNTSKELVRQLTDAQYRQNQALQNVLNENVRLHAENNRMAHQVQFLQLSLQSQVGALQAEVEKSCSVPLFDPPDDKVLRSLSMPPNADSLDNSALNMRRLVMQVEQVLTASTMVASQHHQVLDIQVQQVREQVVQLRALCEHIAENVTLLQQSSSASNVLTSNIVRVTEFLQQMDAQIVSGRVLTKPNCDLTREVCLVFLNFWYFSW